MALMTCPDCSRKVSELAPACIGCGRPLQPSQGTVLAARRPTQIEKTSKVYKLCQLIGGLIFWAGTAFVGVSFVTYRFFNLGVLLVAVGAMIFAMAKTAAWWNHG